MIQRFPREEVLSCEGGYSMNDVYDGLERLASGKKIGPRRMVLICRWFDLAIVNQYMAKQILHQLSKGQQIRIRFPRGRNGKKS